MRAPVSISEVEDSFYNSPSPDFNKKTVDGKDIRLSDFKENVIILRFSRFYLEELPYLLYLEHLSKRFKNDGVSLIFVNSSGKHYKESIEKFVHLSSPIIEDDGSISSSFKASPYETIIIGRDHRIKFKYSRADNQTIYNQVLRFAFEGKSPSFLKDEELEGLIKRLSFKDVMDGKLMKVEDKLKGKSVILNLFISTCMGCPEGRRVRLIKEIAKKVGSKVKILILFGRGNSEEMIREWKERMEFESSVKVGVIEGSFSEEDYLKIFCFDIDPRIMILDNDGKIIYTEKEGDERAMNSEFILRRMK